MLSSLQFWTMIAGLLAFVAKFFYPNFPLDETQILSAVLFLLGLIGVVPTLAARGAIADDFPILKSLPFWTLIAGLVGFIVHYFFPEFPFDQTAILAGIVFILNQFGIRPELRARGILK